VKAFKNFEFILDIVADMGNGNGKVVLKTFKGDFEENDNSDFWIFWKEMKGKKDFQLCWRCRENEKMVEGKVYAHDRHYKY
jgi:hypothetical protein